MDFLRGICRYGFLGVGGFWGMDAVWVVRCVKLRVRVMRTVVGRKWYRRLRVMFR